MLAKVLGLNETQESSLGLVFHYADQQALPLVNLDDVRSLLQYLTSDLGKSELEGIGGVSKQTAGVILRELTNFAANGADVFFGEPEIDTAEFLRTAADGRGIVSLLELPGVAQQPQLFSTFLMWLLADLFSALPEVGDLDKPKLVFFFDEAHLLFADASKEFVSQIVQTVRLIRSKGVGIFFVTQTPKDVPDDVLAQLGSRVQHQLRAHTPNDAKALRATVRTYPNSGYDLEQVLTQLATGEAIVTVMNEKGAPSPVAWTRMRAPQGSMDPTPAAQIEATVKASPLLAKYGTAVDPESAHEILTEKMNAASKAAQEEEEREAAEKQRSKDEKERAAEEKARERANRGSTTRNRTSSRRDKSVVEEVLGSRAAQSAVKEVVRSVFGTLFKKH
jgi:DNA helicase HerA-like ATPase